MTRLQRIMAAFKSAPAPLTSTGSIIGSRTPIPKRTAYREFVDIGYTKNSVSAACIGVRASTLSEAPLVAINDQGERNYSHPLSVLLRQPNPVMSGSDLFSAISTAIDIGGNCYLYKEPSMAGTVMALWPYTDEVIAPITTNGWVTGYLYDNGVERHEWPADRVIHLRNPMYMNPLTPYAGESTVKMASTAIEIMNELEETVYTLAKDNAVPMGMLSAQEDMGPEQQEYLKKRLRDKTKRGEPLILGQMTYTRMGLNMQELDLGSVRSQLESEICGVFRVHPVVAMTYAGLTASTYSNMESAFREFTTLTRVPWWNAIEEQMARGFQREYPSVKLDFDTTKVESLKSDPDAVIYPVIAMFNANLITQNEARQRTGSLPVDDGEKYSYELVPAPSFGAFSLEGIGEDDAVDEVVTDEATGAKRVRWNQRAKDAYWNTQAKAVEEAEAQYFKATEAMFDQAAGQMLGNAKGQRMQVRRIDNLNLQQLYQQWMSSTGKAREVLMQRMIELAVQSVGGDLTQIIGDVEAIKQKAEREVTAKMNESLGQMQKDVSAVLDANKGKPESEVKAALQKAFDTMKSGRSTAIARTTARAESSRALKDTWQRMNDREVDPKRKFAMVWLTRNDDKVRSSHEAMEGVVVDMNSPFVLPNGDTMEAPGLGGSASTAINCRCVVRPVRMNRLG